MYLIKQQNLRQKLTAAVLGDKVSNMRAIYKDFYIIGDKLWERFNQKNKSEHAWYCKTIAELLSELSDTFAYKEYCNLVHEVFG